MGYQRGKSGGHHGEGGEGMRGTYATARKLHTRHEFVLPGYTCPIISTQKHLWTFFYITCDTRAYRIDESRNLYWQQ